MSASQDFFKKNIFSCLGVMIFAVCMVIVFSEAFPKFVALASPDSGPFFSFAPRTGAFEGLLTGSPFTPQKLYWLLLNPLYAHDLTYILDTFSGAGCSAGSAIGLSVTYADRQVRRIS